MTRALVLAGGAGRRLRPITQTRPKPLVPFLVAPFAAGLLDRLDAAGVDRVTFLVGAETGQFTGLVPFGAGRAISVEVRGEERPLDTAGAVRREVAQGPDEPVLVCNGDVLTDLDYRELVTGHRQAGALATIALGRVEDPSAFGVAALEGEPLGRVRAFVEKPSPGHAPSDTASIGTYVLEPVVFDAHPGDGALSFEQEVLPGLVERGALAGLVTEAFWSDIGTPERYLAGQLAALDGRCAWPVPEGVAVDDTPRAVHEQSRIADDAEIGVGSVVGVAATVADHARVAGSVLFDHVAVGPGAVVADTIVGEAARVGAGAQVGPGAVLGDGAVVRDGARVSPGSRVGPREVVG